MSLRTLATFALLAAVSSPLGLAQTATRTLTDADYRLAESRLSYRTEPLVAHTVTKPVFLPGNRVLFRDTAPAEPSGVTATYLLADPATHTVSPAFNHAALAAAIAAVLPNIADESATDLHLKDLTLDDLDTSGHPRLAVFVAANTRLRCSLTPTSATCSRFPDALATFPPLVLSPDGHFAAFLRNWNLWLHDTRTGREAQLTHDGIPDFGYSTDNSGWVHSDRPILVWSPDSRHIATFQQDQRRTGTMSILPVTTGHPAIETWRYPLVGDKDITVIERVLIDVPSGAVTRLKMPPDQHRSTLCDDVSCTNGGWDDVQWAPDSHSIAFVSTSRDHKDEWLRLSDLHGNVRTVFHDADPHFLDSGNGATNWRYLPASNEFLWFSERSNWSNLELRSLASGDLIHPVTSGPGNVTQLLALDPAPRSLLFLGVGRIPGQQPYFTNLFRASLDGGSPTLLTPSNRDHQITLSPDTSTFVDIASTPTEPQITTLRDTRSGAELLPIAQQNISALERTGWHPPTPFTVKARDGETDLFGLLYKPTHFDPSRTYPLIDYIYPGPVGKSCPDPTFRSATGDHQALADLGFVVICLDGMGTAFRSKSFHTTYFGHLDDNTLPDQITGIRQLAARFPSIDLTRVGIWGHSGGGAATAAAMFHYPDFFQVGISESGNQDELLYEDDWAEKWAGLPQRNPDGSSNYDAFANQNFAKNLKGHLFLLHGTSDDNVPLNNTLLVVDALIKANKDFDLLLIPNAHHSYGAAGPYVMRRRWDYFVRNLAGDTPPHDFLMTPYPETRKLLER